MAAIIMVFAKAVPIVKYQSTPMSLYCMRRNGNKDPSIGVYERSALVSKVKIPVLTKLAKVILVMMPAVFIDLVS
jgi:hypothetical protein